MAKTGATSCMQWFCLGPVVSLRCLWVFIAMAVTYKEWLKRGGDSAFHQLAGSRMATKMNASQSAVERIN